LSNQLEEIKKNDIDPVVFYLNKNTVFDGNLIKERWNWLIEQAEKAERYEARIKDLEIIQGWYEDLGFNRGYDLFTNEDNVLKAKIDKMIDGIKETQE
jgi:hypothetical protein